MHLENFKSVKMYLLGFSEISGNHTAKIKNPSYHLLKENCCNGRIINGIVTLLEIMTDRLTNRQALGLHFLKLTGLLLLKKILHMARCTGCSLNIVFFSKNSRKFATSTSPALGCYWLYKKLPANRRTPCSSPVYLTSQGYS